MPFWPVLLVVSSGMHVCVERSHSGPVGSVKPRILGAWLVAGLTWAELAACRTMGEMRAGWGYAAAAMFGSGV